MINIDNAAVFSSESLPLGFNAGTFAVYSAEPEDVISTRCSSSKWRMLTRRKKEESSLHSSSLVIS